MMDRRMNIFQTRRWPEPAEKALDACGSVSRPAADGQLSRSALRDGLAGAEIFCPAVSDTIDAALIEGLDLRGKLIANYGAGTSHIDVAAVRAAGGTISNTPDVLTDCTADIAMLLMLAVARRSGEGERQLRAGDWPGWHPMHLLGTSVTRKVLGLIGFGRIAQAVARRARYGFDMEVIVANRSLVPAPLLAACGARQLAGVEDVLGAADFVSLHIPGGQATHHFLDAARIGAMRPGAFVINTARGTVIDEAALVAALDAGRIAGAGLDVFEEEPAIHPGLLTREDVVLLPHLGSATAETRTAMGMRVVANVRAWIGRRALEDPV
jgi:lactate dehydrogenase-like 2-hydroxyacid dehydrogenase